MDQQAVTIQTAKPEDLGQIQNCARAAYENYIARIGKPPAPMVADFAANIAQGNCYVATVNTTASIIGFVVFYPLEDHIHLENVAVLPEQCGKGVGRKLINFTEMAAQRTGYSKVELYTNEKMIENLALYPSLGYVEFDRKSEAGFERVFFRKSISQLKIMNRELIEADYKALRYLLENDAPNQWNYITEETIAVQFDQLRSGDAVVTLLEGEEILGFSIMVLGEACPAGLARFTALEEITYIQDVAVSKTVSGKGYGSQLLLKSLEIASAKNYKAVYIERHEENSASAGMMRKAGFELVETFYDPNKRFTGSRKSTMMKKQLR